MTAPALTKAQLDHWQDQLQDILEDCLRCIGHMERLDGMDVQSGQLWENGWGYYMYRMNLFVAITQLAKVFTNGQHHLTFTKLFHALRDPVNDGMLVSMLTERDEPGTPHWKNTAEIHEWTRSSAKAIRAHRKTIDAVHHHRNNVTAHTSAQHVTGKMEPLNLPLEDMKALADTGVRLLTELGVGLTGWTRVSFVDTKTFDRLISSYTPEPR